MRKPSFGRSVGVYAVMGFGIALSVIAWKFVLNADAALETQQFNAAVGQHVRTIQTGLQDHFNKLLSMGALFDASQSGVSRTEFEQFSNRILQNQNAILGLTWVPWVQRNERERYELQASIDGLSDFHFRDIRADGTTQIAAERDDYLPIFYSSKEETKSQLYGFNLKDGGVRQAALDEARDENTIVASATLKIRSGQGNRTGFLVVKPVFLAGSSTETLEQRRNSLRGYVLGVFQLGATLDALLSNTNPSINIFVFDPQMDQGAVPLYTRLNDKQAYTAQTTLASLMTNDYAAHLVIAGGRSWYVVAKPMIAADGITRSWLVLLSCLAMTAFATAFASAKAHHEKSLFRLARTDALTGLANRTVFFESLDRALTECRKNGSRCAVHFIDLDGFKNVNDTLGHSVGDRLLRKTASRLQNLACEKDVVARLGGDEFAFLQAEAHEPDADVLAHKIVKTLANPFNLGDRKLTLTSSVGVAFCSVGSETPSETFIKADLALYAAKEDGRNRVRFYDDDMDRRVRKRAMIAEDLERAAERGQLHLVYQPEVEILTQRLVGLEALMRWQHPTEGMISPAVFIPIAERAGLMPEIGRWLINESFGQLANWELKGIAPETLAINLSGAQFKDCEELERDIVAGIQRFSISPERVELELTETVLMEASQKHLEMLRRLQDMGMRLAIDDFGTGYSSLRYLTLYPVDKLKIAHELTSRITEDSKHSTVVKMAISLAKELKIAVVAEGVETDAQALLLRSMSCELAQGFLYAKPASALDATAWLRNDFVKNCLPDFSHAAHGG